MVKIFFMVIQGVPYGLAPIYVDSSRSLNSLIGFGFWHILIGIGFEFFQFIDI